MKCLSCREFFLTSARHGRHLARQKKCEDFYDDLAEKKALQELEAVHARKCQPAPDPDNASRNMGARASSPVGLPPPVQENFLDLRRSQSPQETTNQDEHEGDSAKRRRVTVEEVEDIDTDLGPWICEDYPGLVAVSFGRAVTHFEDMRREQEALGQSVHGPFDDDEEWALAKWLAKRATHTGIDELCKLPIVRPISKTSPSQSYSHTVPSDTQSHAAELQEQEGLLQEGGQAADGSCLDMRYHNRRRGPGWPKRGGAYRRCGALAKEPGGLHTRLDWKSGLRKTHGLRTDQDQAQWCAVLWRVEHGGLVVGDTGELELCC